VTIGSGGLADVVSITATDPKPAFAPRLANTFAEQYIAFRRSADRSKVNDALRLVQRQLRDPALAGRRNLQNRAEELRILASLQTGNAELVQRASVPSSPSSPNVFRNTLLAGVVGLLLGVGLAFLFDRLDRRLRDPREIEGIFGRPILGTIPRSRSLAERAPSTGAVSSADAEAFRMLRANLRYFNVDHEIRSLVVTSSAPGDGKTTVAWNLAAAGASAGKRSLLIEADLRRPRVAEGRGISPGPGLSHVLAGQGSLSSVIQHVKLSGGNGDVPSGTLDVVVAGALPPNPTDLIESDRMRQVIHEAEESYDLVVLDTPPTSVVSDAIPLLREVSGVIVVVRLGKSARESVHQLRNQLRNLNAPTLGVVINAVSRGAGEGYGYAIDYTGSYLDDEDETGIGVPAGPAADAAGDNGGAEAPRGEPVAVRAAPSRPAQPARNAPPRQGAPQATPPSRSGGFLARLRSRR
jgi:receptor protein-tyrosine kinase